MNFINSSNNKVKENYRRNPAIVRKIPKKLPEWINEKEAYWLWAISYYTWKNFKQLDYKLA